MLLPRRFARFLREFRRCALRVHRAEISRLPDLHGFLVTGGHHIVRITLPLSGNAWGPRTLRLGTAMKPAAAFKTILLLGCGFALGIWYQERSADGVQSRLSAASRDPLNPLAPPGGRLEGIREILCLAHDLTVAELHDTHCVCWSPLVRDCVFRDPEITVSENSLDVEA
jgi:hypothetical protein